MIDYKPLLVLCLYQGNGVRAALLPVEAGAGGAPSVVAVALVAVPPYHAQPWYQAGAPSSGRCRTESPRAIEDCQKMPFGTRGQHMRYQTDGPV